MIEITLGEIAIIKESVVRLVEQPFPIAISFRLKKNLEPLMDEIKRFEEARFSLFQKYGEADEKNPQTLKVNEENIEIFNEEFKSLVEEKVEINITKIPIKISDLGNEVKLSTTDLAKLERIVDFQ